MSTWFLLSLLSTVTAGLFMFMQKVAVMRNYNVNIFNTYTAAFSAIFALIIAGVFEGFGGFSIKMIIFSLITGALFIVSSNLRMESLHHIDATIFFPLHKFFSPFFAMLIGLFFFKEALTILEWLGVILGLVTPLLLITKSENVRQNYLVKGLLFMLLSACLSAISAAINKEGATIFSSVLLFTATAYIGCAFAGILLQNFHKKTRDRITVAVKIPITFILLTSTIQYLSLITIMLAFSLDGMLSVVYTINSMYILIPIVLSIIFYNEHWNLQKVVAIALSLLALFFML